MGFKLTKEDLKKSALCPVGIHDAQMVACEEPYIKENGNKIQKCDFETSSGYIVPVWFNAKMSSAIFDFVQAADKIQFKMEELEDLDIELKDYLNKPVAISVSHRSNEGKPMAQIDSFYQSGTVPFLN